jgi:hypothetical protein
LEAPSLHSVTSTKKARLTLQSGLNDTGGDHVGYLRAAEMLNASLPPKAEVNTDELIGGLANMAVPLGSQ